MNFSSKKIVNSNCFVERRAFERIPASVGVRFFYGNMFYSGTISNLSENGMFISTRRYIPTKTMFVVVIRAGNELLKVLAKANRVIKTNGSRDGIGVEILEPSTEYLEFVNKLKVAA
jgi:hypothetical protein